MSIVLTTDFTGEYNISQDDKCTIALAGYIEKYEKVYLTQLLGADLYVLFESGLSGTSPQVSLFNPFTTIFPPFQEDRDGCIIVSEGIRAMLVQFIYWQFVRDQSYINTSTGVQRVNVASFESLGYTGYNLVEAYNQGVRTFCAIQWKIQDDPVGSFSEFNGQYLGPISGI